MAIERDLTLLESLGVPGSRHGATMGVTRAATLSGMDKGQASRRLSALEAESVVDRDPETLEYSLGWRLPALLMGSYPLRVLYRVSESIDALTVQFPGTVKSFLIRRWDRIFIIYSVSASGAADHRPWQSRGLPAWPTAPGRILLSDEPASALRALFPEGLVDPRESSTAGGGIDQLEQALARVREQGFAVSDGDYRPGLTSVAAAVRDDSGAMVGAINVSGFSLLSTDPAERLSELEGIGREITQATAAVSAHLGWNPFPVG